MNRRSFLTGTSFLLGAALLVRKTEATPKYEKTGREQKYIPGNNAQQSAVYLVTHDRIDGEPHANAHTLVLRAGSPFPQCKGCGNNVRYSLMTTCDDSRSWMALNENSSTAGLFLV